MSNEFDDILSEYDKEVELLCKQELDRVGKKIEAKLKQKVIKNNRLNYSPKIYKRNGQLVNNISTTKNDNEVMISWKNLDYESNNGSMPSEMIPQLLNDGFKHEGWQGEEDKYHYRKAENFISETVKEINSEEDEQICEEIRW